MLTFLKKQPENASVLFSSKYETKDITASALIWQFNRNAVQEMKCTVGGFY